MKKIILTLIIILSGFSVFVLAESNNDVYIQHTKSAINKTVEFTNELNTFTDNIIKSGKATDEQKNIYDKKIEDFQNYLKNDKYIVFNYYHPNYPTGEYDSYNNYNFEEVSVDKSIWDRNLQLVNYMEPYEKALRRYKINIILYKNGYRELAAYFSNYTKLPNGVYSLDNMKITKVNDSYVEVDLTNAQYNIYRERDETYGYGSIKIVSPKGNVYFFTGYSPDGDFNGYFVPTARGLKLNCDWNGRKEILLNTENKLALVENEAIMLSDVFFNKYLKQNKVNWNYKNIKFSGDGKGNYYIKIPKGSSPYTDSTRYIHENYFEGGNGDSGNYDVMSEDNGKYEYYWDRKAAPDLSFAIGINNERTITFKDKVIHIDRYIK